MKIATLIGDKATVEVTKDEQGRIAVAFFGSFPVEREEYALEVARHIAQHGAEGVVA